MAKEKATPLILPNRIKELCRKQGISVRQLARDAHISSSKLGEIVSHKVAPTLKEVLSICAALQADSYEIFGLKFDKKFLADMDDVLLGSCIVWISEACSRYKVKLEGSEFSKWVSFVYKEVLASDLNFSATGYLCNTVVKVLAFERKKA